MNPKGWQTKKLRELVASADAGVSVNGEDQPAGSGEFGVLKISSVTEGVFRPEENKLIRAEEFQRAAINPQADRILISRSNTEALVGASAYVASDQPHLFLPDKLWQLQPNPEHSPHMRWLSYWLASNATRTMLSRLATGTSGSMKNIGKDQLLALSVPVPPPAEQHRIANILSTWDKAIATTERLLGNCEEQKLGLMQGLLTGKLRLNRYAEGWKEYLLGKLFTERVEPNRDDLPLLSITKEQGVILRVDVGRKDTSNEDKSKYLRICPGDIGYNTMRMWQGVSALSGHEGIISPAYTVITPGPLIDGKFASYLFKSQPIVFLFYRHSQGLVSDTWNLKFSHFSKIKVRIPSIQEQRSIAEILKMADQQIEVVRLELSALREEKADLLTQLLAGIRRVKLPEAETEAQA